MQRRAFGARLHAVGLALVAAGAVVLAGCGGSGKIDKGGFSSGDFSAAQNALNALAQTAVYDSALNVSLTQAEVPTACVVHIQSKKPLTFRVLMTWTPNPEALGDKGYVRSYAWITADIGASGLKGDYSFHQGNEATMSALKAHYEGAFSKPVEKCLVLQNRKFGLLPS